MEHCPCPPPYFPAQSPGSSTRGRVWEKAKKEIPKSLVTGKNRQQEIHTRVGKGHNKEKKRDPSKAVGKEKKKQAMTESALDRIEFHRHALALMPDPADRRPGIAYFVKGSRSEPGQRFCSCSISRTRTCPHLLGLTKAGLPCL